MSSFVLKNAHVQFNEENCPCAMEFLYNGILIDALIN